jgi:hypothetical protein
VLVVMAGISVSLRAQQVPMAPPPAPAKPPVPAATPATNAAPILPPEALGRYGKILTPSDQPAHPFKLRLPFPDAGQVKIPSQDELVMREKLEQLAMLSDDDIRKQLERWPAYGKMNLRDQGQMLQRIQDFRDFRTNVARMKAHDMGLLTLTPDQFNRFEKEYWDKRLQMDNELAKQFAPIYQAREQKLQDDLYREYSVLNPVPLVQAAKPAAPPAPVAPANKPAAVVNKPAAPVRPVAPAPALAMTNSISTPSRPVAQGPQ